jgi:glycogen synthase
MKEDIDELRLQCSNDGLDHIVNILGFTAPEQLRRLLVSSHASIVPTRSGFAEGMAMTVIEPILLGRPVITNAVVPALEVLRPACIEAKTDDVQSYADAIVNLATSPQLYDRLRHACALLRPQFLDESKIISERASRCACLQLNSLLWHHCANTGTQLDAKCLRYINVSDQTSNSNAID